MTWWTELYDDLLADVLLDRPNPTETERTLDFLVRSLALAPGDRVFDQCCGIGSLSIPLARRGHPVLGVDLVPHYIGRARTDAQKTMAEHQVADAFEFVARPPCAGAYNWWTSFGYADDDEKNRWMLRRAFDSLVAGGRYALDFMNAYQVVRDFATDVVIERKTPKGLVTLWRKSTLEPSNGSISKNWTYHLPDGTRVARSSRVRLYFPHELRALLEASGFEEIHLFGDLDASPLAPQSPRCIAVARRPR